MNKQRLLILVLLVIFFILMGKDIMPTKIEIHDLEIVDVIGLDTTENGVILSVFRSAPSKDEEDEKDKSKNTSAVVSVETSNYTDALKLLKTVTDKYISAWNTKYYLIGEETIKTDLKNVEDFLSRNYETSLTAKVYVTSSMTAKDFLNEMANNDVDLQQNLSNMEEDFLLKNQTKTVDIVDVIDMYLEDTMYGVIPKISVPEEKDKNVKLSFDGAVVLKDSNIVHSLNSKQMQELNFATKNIDYYSFKLLDKDSNNVILGGTDIHVKYNFNFSKEQEIKGINIDVKITCNIEEKHSDYSIYNSDEFDMLKNQIKEEITKHILSIIETSRKIDTDIIDLEKEFMYKHPYKHHKLENAWETLKKVPVTVSVECNIDTTYNILFSNIGQKE